MSAKTIPTAKFRLGRIVATPHALETITQDDLLAGIARHQAGDWGEVKVEDRASNDRALIDGTRIFSVYRSQKGKTFWVITEADRSSTCVLLPEDY
jgi:hypothetical protein